MEPWLKRNKLNQWTESTGVFLRTPKDDLIRLYQSIPWCPPSHMRRRFKVLTLLLAFLRSIRPTIGVYLLMCAAPDRVAHCNSCLQFPCCKELSTSQIWLINHYVKNRKLWGSLYIHCCWFLKSSIKFLSTFCCLQCGEKMDQTRKDLWQQSRYLCTI